ncbi:hypothetical protein BGZ61DRAFT_165009 [Ilyonectria robusta]|uniref:uncharacterized protein n=1 Tax=Ilyonectria robusta TaxID=1079257 RepID=UPI001E8CED7E|nr:uncharacterized protein BGZ61DRAFT_165009 [Ilyonectria robusta]KAH8733719.1 hypothetical protein BGZ61DRAFT_165009 [Ilyonectria robusta]
METFRRAAHFPLRGTPNGSADSTNTDHIRNPVDVPNGPRWLRHHDLGKRPSPTGAEILLPLGPPTNQARLGDNYIRSPKSMAQTAQYAERSARLDTSSFDPRYPDNCTILGLRKSTCSRSSQAGPAPNSIAPHRSIIRSTPRRRQMLRCCHKRGLGESEAKGRGRSPRIITCVSLASAKTPASSGRQALGYSQSGLSI